MHILIIIGVFVLCVDMPLYAQGTEATQKGHSTEEKVGEPAKNEMGLKGLLGGESSAIEGIADEKPLGDTASTRVSERIIEEERELIDELEEEDDLHYLDEDHDE